MKIEGSVLTVGEAEIRLRIALSGHTEEANLEAAMMMEKVTGLNRPVLLTYPERLMSEEEQTRLNNMLTERLKGTPLPYLLGEWYFYGRPFRVNPAVLIPRPETELLIERACQWLRAHPNVREAADIGTGSGCIALTLLAEGVLSCCYGVDISREALSVAAENARLLDCEGSYVPLRGDLTAPLEQIPPLICANLPYIPTETVQGLECARYEPQSALDGGADGFDLYRRLFADVRERAESPSLILCEIEYRQRELALEVASAYFPRANVQVYEDLAGLPRLLEIEVLSNDGRETD